MLGYALRKLFEIEWSTICGGRELVSYASIEPTWGDLVNALSSPTVGYLEIAKRIEQINNQPTLTNASASQSSKKSLLLN